MKNNFEYNVAIIGAGASGLMLASMLSRQNIKVVVIEANNKIGAKILQTGNGKCNFTNLKIDNSCYQNKDNDKVLSIINEFNSEAVIEYFKSLGIYNKQRDGYVYPRSETALSVVNAFRLELEKNKVKMILNCVAKSITKRDKFIINCIETVINNAKNSKKKIIDNKKKQGNNKNNKEELELIKNNIEIKADYVVVATGSCASIDSMKAGKELNVIKSLDINYKEFLPALVALKTDNPFIKLAKGVRAIGKVTILVDGKIVSTDLGEIQYTDYGISGIPVFQVSRYATEALNSNKKVVAILDMIPEKSYEDACKIIDTLVKNGYYKSAREAFDGLINHKLMDFILKNNDIDSEIKVGHLSQKEIEKIVNALKKTSILITGSKGNAFAQVCQGGVIFNEVNNNLESLKYKHLYFAGEIMDVDGKCGGYNLQWAWSSAQKIAVDIIGEQSGKTGN